jgi:site-specific recombinase XerC
LQFKPIWLGTRCNSVGGMGACSKTIQGYNQDKSIFLRWWQGGFIEELTIDGLRSDPFRLNRKVSQDFLSWLQTTQRYSASLQAFCQYLLSIETIQHDPALDLRLPGEKTQEPKGLDDAQRSRFESAFQFP